MPLTFRGHLRITLGVEATSEIKSYGERRIRMKMKQVLQDFSENVSVRKDIILRSSQRIRNYYYKQPSMSDVRSLIKS